MCILYPRRHWEILNFIAISVFAMELHPILEQGILPNEKLWYILSGAGLSPSMRVGHTCTHVPSSVSTSSGKIYVIGGANPDGPFGEMYILDLDNFTWDTCESIGFKARYEHTAFVVPDKPNCIYVFGGADQAGNLNDVQMFDLIESSWSTVATTGSLPCPRTFHNGACVGNSLIVYSGGNSGTDPVGDRQVYALDIESSTWNTLRITGDPPKPRLGHLMLSVGNKIYVHGGMSGITFYDDLHILDLERNCWVSVKQKKGSPPGRNWPRRVRQRIRRVHFRWNESGRRFGWYVQVGYRWKMIIVLMLFPFSNNQDSKIIDVNCSGRNRRFHVIPNKIASRILN